MSVDNLPEDPATWGIPEVKRWLRQGFSSWGQPTDAPPFFPLNGYFTELDTPERQLAQLCEPHPEFRQLVLQATKSLLEDLPPDNTGFRLFNDLQRLIIAVHEPDLLHDMWRRLASPNFLQRAEPDIRKELFAQAFVCVEKLASSSTAFDLLIRTMITSRHFEPTWAPSALYSMLCRDPSKLATSLQTLSYHVDGIRDQEAIRGIVEGCGKAIAEVFPNSDQLGALESMISHDLRELAESGESISAQVARNALVDWEIEIPETEPTGPRTKTSQILLLLVNKVKAASQSISNTVAASISGRHLASSQEVTAQAVVPVADEDFATLNGIERFIGYQQAHQPENRHFEAELKGTA